MMKFKKNNGFTLAEVLITLVMIGVVATLTIPALLRTSPDKTKMMFKKAHFTLEQTVSQLINDSYLYPDNDDWSNPNTPIGFQNTGLADGCQNNWKFACLFSKQLNVISTNCENDFTGDTCEIEGTDGIIWTIPKCNFDAAYTNQYCNGVIKILFDVNGNKGPGCAESTPNCDNPDQFSFIINREGRISVPGALHDPPQADDPPIPFADMHYYQITRDYLRSTSPIQGKD